MDNEFDNGACKRRFSTLPDAMVFRTIDLMDVKEWASTLTFIPEMSDETIKLFLHSCYYNVDDTKETIKSYYTLRMKSPELFTNRDFNSDSIQTVLQYLYAGQLPGTTEEGYKVFIVGFLKSGDASGYVFADSMKYMIMNCDMILSKEKESGPGFVVLIDHAKFSMEYFAKFKIDVIRKVISYFQDAFPVRLKRIIFFNVAPATNFLLKISRPFLSERVLDMLFTFPSGDDGLWNYIPKNMMPVELGGENSEISIQQFSDDMNKQLIEHREYFEKEDEKLEELIRKQPIEKRRSIFGIINY